MTLVLTLIFTVQITNNLNNKITEDLYQLKLPSI